MEAADNEGEDPWFGIEQEPIHIYVYIICIWIFGYDFTNYISLLKDLVFQQNFEFHPSGKIFHRTTSRVFLKL